MNAKQRRWAPAPLGEIFLACGFLSTGVETGERKMGRFAVVWTRHAVKRRGGEPEKNGSCQNGKHPGAVSPAEGPSCEPVELTARTVHMSGS
jgi:hypothetical protein